MSTIINYLIPLSVGIYLLLILKGVIRLSPQHQIRFDEFVNKKRRLFIGLAYLLIFICVLSAIIELYVSLKM